MGFSGLRGPRQAANKGKFTPLHAPGVEARGDHQYQGVHYQLGHTRVGVTHQRDCYNVTIYNVDGQTTKHLSGFTTPMQAHKAAQQWIENAAASEKLRHDRAHRPAGRSQRT